jgi:hypothetical protein
MSPARIAPLVALLAAAGCAFDPPPAPPPPPTPIPVADTPQHAIERFVGTYETFVIADYGALFTKDFRFTFSSQSDPELAAQYGTSWGKDDELESTSHLFAGFVDAGGTFQPAAVRIDLELPFTQELDDPFHPDSIEHYRLVAVPRLLLDIGLSDERGFNVDAPHDFYLVRGDAAVLDDAQEARADRWYVYRWDDRSSALPQAAWARARARYRE